MSTIYILFKYATNLQNNIYTKICMLICFFMSIFSFYILIIFIFNFNKLWIKASAKWLNINVYDIYV